ncbi:hypothetical protein CP8484711_1492 [Chlamydia psittaci 84-8471/1]|nr:hypothetical protein CP03DC29_0800 [Chlamydia psittaci 03DC29]EPJ29048.1 hypothetical protein CPC1998_0369 [Chlamydia psittaci C19/98]EPP36772.1 hypothetical protein CP8484711_1492 [Chlamydia psittaci 84-8471/1]
MNPIHLPNSKGKTQSIWKIRARFFASILHILKILRSPCILKAIECFH